MPSELRPFARYLRGLRGYLKRPLRGEDTPALVERALAARAETFLRVLERGVFEQPSSAYRRLLNDAGVEPGDVARMVRAEGVEGALGRLYDGGVRVSLEEFKSTETGFDNPLLARHYEARTGGSRSAGRRIVVDLDLLAHEAAYHWLFLSAHGLSERPFAIWHAAPPGAAGLKAALYEAKLGRSAERWFTQVAHASPRFALFTRCTTAAGRLWGRRIPYPEHVPAGDPASVVGWLAEKRAAGAPAVVSTNPSSAVRACNAAAEAGVDISGTVFFIGGEPVSPAKVQRVTASGSLSVPVYAMAELGLVGIGCPAGEAIDDVHLFSDKVAIVQRDVPVGGGASVGALFFTSLLPSCPKLMLNVESGDYGVLRDRPCNCAFGELGLTRRLSGIRSHEKLTSEGSTFLGGELITLVEETLPARFGGSPTDYQLVEAEEAGLPRVSIVVSPRLPDIDEDELVRTVLGALDARPNRRQMARVWGEGHTLRVERREPYTTAMSKVLPLHVPQGE